MNWRSLVDEFRSLLLELIAEIRALREELKNARTK